MTTLTKEQVEHFREPLKRQIRRDTILHIPISDEMKAVDQLIDLALRGLEVTQEDETAWLVEAFSGQTENYFAGLDEIWNGGFSLYPRWTADHMKAIRFTRKEDAETIVSVMDSTAKCRAVEHSWMASPPISEENCSGHVASENDAKVCGRGGWTMTPEQQDLLDRLYMDGSKHYELAYAEITRLTAALKNAEQREGRGIYTASKTVHAPLWKRYRNLGAPIISTWLDEAGVGETADFSDLWLRCISEASSCAALIAYREPGEILKGAFIEIGAALANGRQVYCVGDFEGMSFINHPLVVQSPNVAAAIRAMVRP